MCGEGRIRQLGAAGATCGYQAAFPVLCGHTCVCVYVCVCVCMHVCRALFVSRNDIYRLSKLEGTSESFIHPLLHLVISQILVTFHGPVLGDSKMNGTCP